MRVGKINWIKYDGIDGEMEAVTKIRYKDKGTLSVLYPGSEETRYALSVQQNALSQQQNALPLQDNMTVRFYEKAKGIAPGQSAVFYEGDDVIGGGIIQRQAINI
jgi:tRNA-specific 2-thiouridylase